jgi:hypothetical protein
MTTVNERDSAMMTELLVTQNLESVVGKIDEALKSGNVHQAMRVCADYRAVEDMNRNLRMRILILEKKMPAEPISAPAAVEAERDSEVPQAMPTQIKVKRK